VHVTWKKPFVGLGFGSGDRRCVENSVAVRCPVYTSTDDGMDLLDWKGICLSTAPFCPAIGCTSGSPEAGWRHWRPGMRSLEGGRLRPGAFLGPDWMTGSRSATGGATVSNCCMSGGRVQEDDSSLGCLVPVIGPASWRRLEVPLAALANLTRVPVHSQRLGQAVPLPVVGVGGPSAGARWTSRWVPGPT
jgi:hypothetical protein